MELHNGVHTINISGHLSSVGKWVEETDLSNRRILHTVRVDPIDSDGYFKNNSFNIIGYCSSVIYG